MLRGGVTAIWAPKREPAEFSGCVGLTLHSLLYSCTSWGWMGWASWAGPRLLVCWSICSTNVEWCWVPGASQQLLGAAGARSWLPQGWWRWAGVICFASSFRSPVPPHLWGPFSLLGDPWSIAGVTCPLTVLIHVLGHWGASLVLLFAQFYFQTYTVSK